MDESGREEEALFRYAVLGPVLSERLRRGERRGRLRELAKGTFEGPDGGVRRMSWKTLEEWYYRYAREGFEGLKPRPRSDRGKVKALRPELVELICELKREDPGRSAPLILRELELAGLLGGEGPSAKTIQRVLARHSLNGPRLELDRPVRYRWRASEPNELWQADAVHGPLLLDPATGRRRRAVIFALLDDHSRLIAHIGASGFTETEHAFLGLLGGAVARRGIPRVLYPDRGPCFMGRGLHLVCAKLGIRLLHTPPRDAPAKGKVERFFRHLRARVLDRLDPERVTTLDELNLRLTAWVETEYQHAPHSGLEGNNPADVWEAGAEGVRWLDTNEELAEVFVATVDRTARNDATVRLNGRSYEVPGHLRRQRLKVRYSLLRADQVWVVDEPAGVEVPISPVDPEANADRPRHRRGGDPEAGSPPSPSSPKAPPRGGTGLNAVELVLDRAAGRRREGGR